MTAQAAAIKPVAVNNAAAQAAQLELNIKIFKRNLGNAAVSRILDLIDLVVSEPKETLATYEFWQHICRNYAMPHAALRITVPRDPAKSEDDTDSRNTKLYTLSVNTAPRFFLANVLASNISKQQLSLPGLRFHVMNSGSVFMASRLSILYTYKDGSSTHLTGVCRLVLSRDFRMDLIDCHILSHASQVSLLQLEKRWLSSCKNDNKEKEFMKRLFSDTILKTSAKNCGFEENAMRILQISDVMTQLRPLMAFTMANNINSPIKALDTYVNVNSQYSGAGTNIPMANSSARAMLLDFKNQPKKRKVSNAISSPINPDLR